MAKSRNRVNLSSLRRTDSNYYFILPYAKHLKVFFAAELQDLLMKNEFEFTSGAIVAAIDYWIAKGIIEVLPTKYLMGETPVKKYIYIRDPK